MGNFIVFVADVMENFYDTLVEAENRVAEIISKYPFVDPDLIHIVENRG